MSPRAGPSRLTSSALVSPGRGLVEELAEKLHQLLLLGGRQSTVDVVAAEGRHGDEVLAEEVVSDGGTGRTRLGFFAGPAISVSPITSIPSPSRQSIPLRRGCHSNDPCRQTGRGGSGARVLPARPHAILGPRCCEPEHSEQMRTQMRHARNHGGISGPAAKAQRPQDVLRFAVRRISRAFVRATSSSADRFGAVPKNTSSGVWPRNAA